MFQTFRKMDEQAERKIDRESEELILVGHVMAVAGEAGQICRMYPNDESGFDGEIEFRDETGQASEVKVLLKFLYGVNEINDISTESRSSRFEVVSTLYIDESVKRVLANSSNHIMVVCRNYDGQIRWVNHGTSMAKFTNEDETLREIAVKLGFEDNRFTALSLIQKRDEILGSAGG